MRPTFLFLAAAALLAAVPYAPAQTAAPTATPAATAAPSATPEKRLHKARAAAARKISPDTPAPAAGPAAAAATPAPATAAAPASAPAPAASPAPVKMTRAEKKAAKAEKAAGEAPTATVAPGGGPGMVWVNTKSHVYHESTSRWYGKTKEGKYMTEKDAIAEGDKAHVSKKAAPTAN